MDRWLECLKTGIAISPPSPDSTIAVRTGASMRPAAFRREPVDGLRHPRPYEWVDYRRYRRRGALAGIQTKRGAPSSAFTALTVSSRGAVRALRTRKISFDEMEGWNRAVHPPGFDFVDSVFNTPRPTPSPSAKRL